MNISGRELMRLLERDGWISGGRRTHGIFYYKRFPRESMPRSTVIPDKSSPLPRTTLGAILSLKQTGLGSAGLRSLMDRKQ
ncbi:MAG: type II toxin-antitoxin system HicA family toxin [Dehalococcoidia bacterium]|nr:type II toxin-antitoxin system HicA family toxin [Dehalococcoidia bacterium]